jgi:hypothetical protein
LAQFPGASHEAEILNSIRSSLSKARQLRQYEGKNT